MKVGFWRGRLIPTFFTTIRARLIALFTVIFGLSLVAVAVISYQMFSATHLADFDASLYNHAVDVASTLGGRLFDLLPFSPFSLETEEKKTLFPLRRSFLQVRNLDGSLLAKSRNMGDGVLPLNSRERLSLLQDGVLFSSVDAAKLPDSPGARTQRFRLITYLVRRNNLPVLILQIAAPMTLVEQSQNRLINLFLILVPLALLLSAGTGYAVADRAFAPIRAMIKKTSDIQVKNLDVRVQISEEDPELEALATTLNSLLSRVEQAVHLQERFIADASHQLKTPLAIMKGEMELLLRDAELSEKQRVYLSSIASEISQLIRLVENLLMLAKMDAGHGVILFQKVRFDEVVLDTVAKLSRLFQEKAIQITPILEPMENQSPGVIDFEAEGDADLLRSLLVTLLENALKYSESGTQVFVRLKETVDKFVMEVQDQGVGLARSEIHTVFERFNRNMKQALKTSGSGLGLAIARRIVEIHKGSIRVESELGKGSTFIVEINKF